MRICDFPECGRGHYARGYCKTHYRQQYEGRQLKPIRVNKVYPALCTFPGCGSEHYSGFYCSAHYQQYKTGKELKPRRVDYGSVCIFPECGRKLRRDGYCTPHCRQLDVGESLRPIRMRRNTSTLRDGEGRKQCSRCRRWLAEERFCRYGRAADGLNGQCKDCQSNRRPSNAERHGVSLEWYEKAKLQGCEICGEITDLHIDHDHTCCPGNNSCGECVRGILCRKHNTALGLFQDDADHLIAAAFYLSKVSGVKTV